MNLSDNEIKCAQLAIMGRSRHEIAKEMFLSKRAIDYNFNILKKKFGANNLVELGAKLALLSNSGLVDSE